MPDSRAQGAVACAAWFPSTRPPVVRWWRPTSPGGSASTPDAHGAPRARQGTAFPLSKAVGEAIVDYLQHGRPKTTDRHVFFRSAAPVQPIGSAAVSARAARYLLRADVQVPRPGSHTLRHSLLQRLVDFGFGVKEIGDFVGHRSPRSTQIYGKVAVESLRQVALGDGEEVFNE